MSVWGDVIFQPRPDLPDIPLVTIHLQRRDDRFYSSAQRILICNYQLADLGQTQVCPNPL